MRTLVDPRKLPPWQRRVLQVECDGEWQRVTDDGDGNYTVHNNAVRASMWVDKPAVKPVRRAPAPVNGTPVPKERTTQPGKALTALVGTQAPTKIEPGVNVVRVVRTPEEEQARAMRVVWSKYAGNVDWEKISPEATAVELFDFCKRGLPAAIPFGYHPEVLSLAGLNMDEIETALRMPERVQIRPETKGHRYPILGFFRGDVCVILGMRTPVKPIVIAAYWFSLLEGSDVRTAQNNASGGGGARKPAGAPTTLKRSVQLLRAYGAEVPDDWETASKPISVSYQGQSLGKMTVGIVVKKQLQDDYARMRSRMVAIDRKLQAG